MGIKLSDEQTKQAARSAYSHNRLTHHSLPEEPCPLSTDRAIADAATAHALREIDKMLRTDYSDAHEQIRWMPRDTWRILLAEAGVEEANTSCQ